MPLDGNALGEALKAAVLSIPAPPAGSVSTYTDAYYKALGNTIVDYFKANAVIQTDSGAPNSEHTGHIE